MERHGLFRKDKQQKQGDGSHRLIHIREQLKYMAICLRIDDESAKSSWIRNKEQTSTGDTAVGT